ncbi:MAG: gliding motility-associated ABC transporter substrate-binding protein GldG [Bacteroidota bacterium]
MSSTKRKSSKQSILFRLLVVIGIIVLLNLLASRIFFRADLTSDKRFTLSRNTKVMLRDLKDNVFVKIYLTGDMPAGFKRLANSTRDLLDEMKIYAGDRLQYQFEDPLEGKTEKEKNDILKELAQNGLEPTNVTVKAEDAYSQKLIIPGAVVYFHSGVGVPVNLLNNESGMKAQNALNNSEAQLEYKFSSAIATQLSPIKTRVSFLRGQGEKDLGYLYDFVKTLTSFYEADTLQLDGVLDVKKKTDVLVIVQPTKTFNEQDKFKLDQFVMNGGKILWMIDALNASLDSLSQKPSMLALDYQLNLDDQLFTYGVRLNTSLLMDLVCNPVPLMVQNNNPADNQPQFKLFPCTFFPVLTPDLVHPITYGIDAVSTIFPATLDTVATTGIKKTVLLHSSKYSKLAFSPYMVDMRELRKQPDVNTFSKKNYPVAVLLEGKFKSLYQNRMTDQLQQVLRDSLKTPFKESSEENKMIVIADGDIASNEFGKNDQPFSLGYYKYTGDYFNNKNFLLNCIDYLTGNQNNIDTRGKQVKLRLLDTQKVKAEKTKWQFINIGIPILLMILFGIMFTVIRVKKYSRL